MAAISTFLANKLLDGSLKNTAYTPAATVYAALMTVAPTAAGGGTEVSGNAYARQACAFGSASANASANSGTVTYPAATPSGWGVVVAVAFYDASTVGNLLYWETLSGSITVAAGNVVSFTAGQLNVTMV